MSEDREEYVVNEKEAVNEWPASDWEVNKFADPAIEAAAALTKRQPGDTLQTGRAQQAPLSESARLLREEALGLEKRTRNLMRHNMFDKPQSYFGQHDEVRAQLTLAVRAFEDARMRLGKALQYAGDGVSVYDRM
jgi:hypothetical protein